MKMTKILWLALLLSFAVPTWAGNLWLTGHDADLHCSGGDQCNHFGIALDFARQDAPDKTKPLLFLDRLNNDLVAAESQAAARARNTVQGAGNPFPFVTVDPRSPAFAGMALTTSAFSAIVIASDITCGGCDLNEFGSTPDSDAINARAADLQNFFNAGGGLVFFAGANNRAVYYNAVPIPATAVAVSPPFTLTAQGVGLGLTNDDANCCPTHNSFEKPASGSALKIAELDSAGFAETLFAGNAKIGGGGVVGAPEPNAVLLLGFALLALGAFRFRSSRRFPIHGRR